MPARLEYGDPDRKPDHQRKPLLVNLSGGVDSVYAAWRLLERGHRLLLHHCVMRNEEGRAEVEKAAVDQVLVWLRSNRKYRFDYIESGYDHGSLGRVMFDVEVIGFLTGVILRDPARHRINTVVVSSNAGDVSVTKPQTSRVVRRQEIAEMVAARKLRWWVPFAEVTKQQMVAALPDELRGMVWSCRKPREGGTCKVCRPCREIAEFEKGRQLQLAASQEGPSERRSTHRASNRGVRASS